jgi:hypothetical protein
MCLEQTITFKANYAHLSKLSHNKFIANRRLPNCNDIGQQR